MPVIPEDQRFLVIIQDGRTTAYQTRDGRWTVNVGAYVPLEQQLANWRRFGTTNPQSAAVPEPVKIVFAALPKQHQGNFCPCCDGFIPNARVETIRTDQGEHTGYTCPNCGVKFLKKVERESSYGRNYY